MFELNGILYAESKTNDIKVIDAKPLNGGMMLITFSTGEKRLFDTTKLIGSVFAPLQNEAIFMNPKIIHGFVTWNNEEIDIAPETMYDESYPYTEKQII